MLYLVENPCQNNSTFLFAILTSCSQLTIHFLLSLKCDRSDTFKNVNKKGDNVIKEIIAS